MSDIALITTTIGTADILRAYRADDADVEIIIAGDLRSPHDDLRALCREMGNARYLSPEDQDALGYEVGRLAGWRCVQRRNVAILEAMRVGADIIYTMDDDIGPDAPGFFAGVRARLGMARGNPVGGEWVNPGAFGSEDYVARGFPWQERDTKWAERAAAATIPVTASVGVHHCLHLGDPDADAIENMVRWPTVITYEMPDDDECILVNPATTFSPLNTGATAYARAVAPLLNVIPGVGRYDDIWAGYIAERILGEMGLWVGYGAPFTRHTRNAHDLMRDLDAEVFGMRHTLAFCELLREMSVSGDNPVEALADVAEGLRGVDPFANVVLFLDAWVEDVARVWTP